ncbi:MAG: SLC13 family permease [Verrucomicrobiota bacterium]
MPEFFSGEWQVTLTVTLFLLSYGAIAVGHIWGLKLDRVGIAMVAAILMLLIHALTVEEAVNTVDMGTILTLFGLMVLSGQLRLAGFYTLVAEKIAAQLERPARFLLVLMATAAVMSAFLINDVVCLAFAPVLTAALLKKGLNPVPFLIGLALAANIGSAATLIGNPQNILIGQVGELRFGAFLLWSLTPVVLSLAVAYGMVLLLGGKKMTQPPETSGAVQLHLPPIDRGQTIRGVAITAVVVVLFFTPLPHELVALGAAAAILCSRVMPSSKVLAMVDWPLLVLFCSLFIVVGALSATGVDKQVVAALGEVGVSLDNLYVLGVVSAVLSNLMSNVPAILVLLSLQPVSSPDVGYVLALSSTFAGNFILLGSIANLIVVEQAGKLGVKIGFWEFARYGIPVTLLSIGILFLWLAFAQTVGWSG